jgi:pilus assembly protein CpaE
MLVVAVVSKDLKSSNDLQACLRQTSLVDTVQQWTPSPELYPASGEPVPDVMLVDFSGDTQPYLEFASHVRRLFPAIHIIGCSNVGPSPELLLTAMRAGIRDFLSKPVELAVLKDALVRLGPGDSAKYTRPLGKLIAVVGTKGGVGTSTVAVNLAVQVSRMEKKVILLDFGRPLGDDCLLLDLHPRFCVRDAAENLDRLDAHFFARLVTHHKCGLDVLAGTSHPDEWQHLTVSALARVVTAAQSQYDFVIIDFGSFYSSEWKPVLGGAEVLLVAEANVSGLSKLERHVTALSSLGVQSFQIRIVINRWHRRDDEAIKTVEKKLGHPIFARLPNDYRQVSEASSLGMPLLKNHGDPLGTRLRELACEVADVMPPAEMANGGFARFFSLN